MGEVSFVELREGSDLTDPATRGAIKRMCAIGAGAFWSWGRRTWLGLSGSAVGGILMTERSFEDLCQNAEVVRVGADSLELVQHKDRRGVCIIPESQDAAAREIILTIGRTLDSIEGSKRGGLVYTFTPELTEDDYARWFCASRWRGKSPILRDGAL